MNRGGPPTSLADELAAAAALRRARELHGEPPAPASSPSAPPEPAPNSPEDVGFLPAETRPAHEPKHCRSCGRSILWAQVLEDDRRTLKRKPDGKPQAMPVDFQPDAVKGNVVCLDRDGSIVCYVLKEGELAPAGARLRTSHFATCPNAAHHRRRGGRR